MGRSGLTWPRSFLAFAAGWVLPLRVTSRLSSIRSTIRTAGANCWAIAATGQSKALANAHRGSERIRRMVGFLDLPSGIAPEHAKSCRYVQKALRRQL